MKRWPFIVDTIALGILGIMLYQQSATLTSWAVYIGAWTIFGKWMMTTFAVERFRALVKDYERICTKQANLIREYIEDNRL